MGKVFGDSTSVSRWDAPAPEIKTRFLLVGEHPSDFLQGKSRLWFFSRKVPGEDAYVRRRLLADAGWDEGDYAFRLLRTDLIRDSMVPRSSRQTIHEQTSAVFDLAETEGIDRLLLFGRGVASCFLFRKLEKKVYRVRLDNVEPLTWYYIRTGDRERMGAVIPHTARDSWWSDKSNRTQLIYFFQDLLELSKGEGSS